MDIGDPNLRPLCILGEGSFGHVFLCKCKLDCGARYVCVKRIRIRQPNQEMKMLMDEIYIISQLRHPNIIKFFRAFVYRSSVNIVMEYATNGTVRDAINGNIKHFPPIKKNMFYSIIFDILLGLEYLHIRHIIHRDLKPENILLDKENRIKIADFGISTVHSSHNPTKGLIGTYYYMAPEVMRGERHDFKSDVWSLGCVLYEMCNGVSPFQNAKNLIDLKGLVLSSAQNGLNFGSISHCYGIEWGCLCEKMLNVDAKKRVSVFSIVTGNPRIAISYYNNYFKCSK
ncbi:PREDICTED: serine/threonine-protein kinase Nek5 [Rhagoletis zephyria]|uniref:serine/threonine-protein kinase Nek5 n=1 Tax=Rhagoletis zephyria TaxID=28612 RepID=UPI0008113D01|nr:PREDICTED: serine/threonine-protein kinase Nek5 [Rhagoletis zephyria]